MNNDDLGLAQIDQLVPLVQHVLDGPTSHAPFNDERRFGLKTASQRLVEEIRVRCLEWSASLTLARHCERVSHDDDFHSLAGDVVQSRIGCNTPFRVTP